MEDVWLNHASDPETTESAAIINDVVLMVTVLQKKVNLHHVASDTIWVLDFKGRPSRPCVVTLCWMVYGRQTSAYEAILVPCIPEWIIPELMSRRKLICDHTQRVRPWSSMVLRSIKSHALVIPFELFCSSYHRNFLCPVNLVGEVI